MNDVFFDALTRRSAPRGPAAGGVSRRASIMTLGTAGLAAALGSPFTADAKKKGGKNKKKKKCRDRCKPQVGQCTTAIAGLCAGDPTCLDSALCCPILGSCDFSGFFACLVASSSQN